MYNAAAGTNPTAAAFPLPYVNRIFLPLYACCSYSLLFTVGIF